MAMCFIVILVMTLSTVSCVNFNVTGIERNAETAAPETAPKATDQDENLDQGEAQDQDDALDQNQDQDQKRSNSNRRSRTPCL